MEKGAQRGAEHLLQFQGNPVVRVRATPRQHTAVQGSEREIPAPAAQARSRTLAGANTCFHVSHHGPMRAWLARAAAEPAYRARY